MFWRAYRESNDTVIIHEKRKLKHLWERSRNRGGLCAKAGELYIHLVREEKNYTYHNVTS